MGEIRINYANARRQARKLRSAAEECNQVINRLRSAESEIPQHWNGEAANTYLLELNERIRDIGRLENDLRMLANAIQQAADRFEEAERRLKESMST